MSFQPFLSVKNVEIGVFVKKMKKGGVRHADITRNKTSKSLFDEYPKFKGCFTTCKLVVLPSVQVKGTLTGI